MYALISAISLWTIPVLLSVILVYGLYKKIPVYESFISGAKQGFGTTIKIMPHLVAMMVAVTLFRESGVLDLIIKAINPLLAFINFPSEVVPLALLRSVTGSGSLAITSDLISQFGPDSLIGRLASTIQGSSETTLYVLTVYFGAVAIRNTKYALKVGLIADFIGIVASFIIVSLVFG